MTIHCENHCKTVGCIHRFSLFVLLHGVADYIPFGEPQKPIQGKLTALAFASHIVLDVFATLNIMIRLFQHQRSMVAAFGSTSSLTKRQLPIVGILMESAVINIPITIGSLVTCFIRNGFPLVAIFGIVSPAHVRFILSVW